MGEPAALATSFFWSFTSLQFTVAGRRVGSVIVNRIRLVLAVLFLSVAHLLVQGEWLPLHAEPFRWGWLGLSGTIGLVLGDASLFQSFVLIGPRRAMVLMTLVPVFGALVAGVWLGETLRLVEAAAMLLTIIGIAWVVLEKGSNRSPASPTESTRTYVLGVLLGLGGALGQALGLAASRKGLQGDFPPLSATLMRMSAATVVIWLFTLARRQSTVTWRALADMQARTFILGGALTGPVIGVWLSMVAVQRANVSIASTLMALSLIILIPFERWIFSETISPRSIAGTLVALAGVTLIFLT